MGGGTWYLFLDVNIDAMNRTATTYRIFRKDKLLVLFGILSHGELYVFPRYSLQEVQGISQDEVFGYMWLTCVE